MYNEKVMEIFKNPHNVGELKDANAIGQVGNVACGDIMKIYLKINENKVIEDASFKTFGCAAAIVSSSIATDMIKGMTIEEALQLDNDKIIEIAGGLPVHKVHCSVLAKEAIENAINDYYKRIKKAEKKAQKEASQPKKETKKTAKQKEVQPLKEEVPKTENKKEVPAFDAKNLLSGLKSAKAQKEASVVAEPVREVKSKKELKKAEADKKKEEAKKAKSAKKVEKNFKNLSERLNKLKK